MLFKLAMYCYSLKTYDFNSLTSRQFGQDSMLSLSLRIEFSDISRLELTSDLRSGVNPLHRHAF